MIWVCETVQASEHNGQRSTCSVDIATWVITLAASSAVIVDHFMHLMLQLREKSLSSPVIIISLQLWHLWICTHVTNACMVQFQHVARVWFASSKDQSVGEWNSSSQWLSALNHLIASSCIIIMHAQIALQSFNDWSRICVRTCRVLRLFGVTCMLSSWVTVERIEADFLCLLWQMHECDHMYDTGLETFTHPYRAVMSYACTGCLCCWVYGRRTCLNIEV